METLTREGRESWFPSRVSFSQFNRMLIFFFYIFSCFFYLEWTWAFSLSRASITSNLTVIKEVLQSDISGRGMTKKKKKWTFWGRRSRAHMLGCLWTQYDVMWLGESLEARVLWMSWKENVSHHPPAVGAQRQGFQPKDNLEIAVKDFPQASMASSGT